MPTKTKPNKLVLSFQQWIKDNYPNEDLGDYGVNKDGVDGVLGTKTKKLFEKYGRDFKRDSGVEDISITERVEPLKDKEQQSKIERAIVSRGRQGMGNQDNTSARDRFFEKSARERTANQMGKDFADAEMIKGRGIADLIAPAIGIPYGLAQMIKGKKLSKNLKPPKRVEPQLPNQQLSSLLAQVGVNANMADPKIREQAIRDITTNRELANEAARVASSGDVNAFAQNAQRNYLNSNDAIRKMASDETSDIFRNRQLFNNLIGQKMAEDNTRHNELVRNFENIDMPEFEKQRQYAAQLSNQGISNLFGGINNVAGNSVPLLSGYNNIMSGYKARYNSMTPDEKKAFAMKYPKIASKYEQDNVMNPQMAQGFINPNVAKVLNVQPQELPVNNQLSYNWLF